MVLAPSQNNVNSLVFVVFGVCISRKHCKFLGLGGFVGSEGLPANSEWGGAGWLVVVVLVGGGGGRRGRGGGGGLAGC